MQLKSLPGTIILSMIAVMVYSQSPKILWQKTIGGTKNDSLVTIQPTKDGGFIISGHSNSNKSDDKTQYAYTGSYDFWIVKLDKNGKLQWDKTIGGNGPDLNCTIIQTSDGGYLVGGKSQSDLSGNKTESAFNRSYDYWIVKLNENGNVEWNNTIGGIQLDVLVALTESQDGAFILAGYSHSEGLKSYKKHSDNIGPALWSDYWVLKLEKEGKKILWEKTYGGKNEDILTSMKPVAKNNEYILGGYSYSTRNRQKTENFFGNGDYWIIKIDDAGNEIFDKTIGGKLSDFEMDAQQTSDGGYILGGYSNSPISYKKSGKFIGYTDYWVVKTNAKGELQWDKTLGGTLGDYLSSVQETADHGYLIGGTSSSDSSATKSQNSKGREDFWILKLNDNGKIVWDKTLGGSGADRLSIVKEISDGEYIAGGTSNSPVSGNKTGRSIGGNDYWIVRLSSNPSVAQQADSTNVINLSKASPDITENLSFTATPNPTKGLVELNYKGYNSNKLSLIVYDNKGKIILQKTVRYSAGHFTLDLSNHAAGLYYAVLSSGKNFITTRIVKE